MGENAVAQKWGNSSDPETDRTKNLQKFTVIPHNLVYEEIFFQKDLHKIEFFVNCFLNVAAYGKGPSFHIS